MAVLTTSDQLLSEKYVTSTGYGNIYMRIYGRYNTYNSSAGTVNVTTTLSFYLDNGSMYADGNSWSLDGKSGSGDLNVSAGLYGLISSTYDVTVNNDGSSKGYTSNASYTIYGTSGSMSASFDTPTVPRYATISSFSVSKRDETSVTFNWNANATIDYVWYSTNDGSSWTGYDTPDGTSGSFTVSGLSANTTYNFKLRVRRKDSQLNTTSSRVQQTTYDYPYCSSSSNFIIGDNINISLYNPLGRTVSLKFYGDDNSLICSASRNINGATAIGSNSDEINAQYNSIPNKPSGTYKVEVIYGSITKTRNNAGTYTINTNECVPTFEEFEYSTDLSNLTGDNETIISGETTTTFIISTDNKAIAKNSASIVKYRIECGSVEAKEINESESTLTDTLSGCNDAIIKVTAIDSRGVEKTVSKTVTNFKTYVAPSFASIQVERKDGVDAETNLDFVVNYWNYSFGLLTNEITKIEYRTKQSSSSTWSEWYNDIDVSEITYDNDKAILQDVLIHENGSSGGFTVGTQFDIQVRVSDGNSTIILNSVESSVQTLTDGKVAISILKDNNGEYHIGINCMPDINSTLVVNGNPIS